MAELLTFIGAHPVVSFFLTLILVNVVTTPFTLAFKAYNRTLRSRNILERGWPPTHLDADGDFKPE